MSALADRVEAVLGRRPASSSPLAGGSVGAVLRLDFENSPPLVAKLGPGLASEAFMLAWLAEHTRLPLPRVLHGDDSLILMEMVAGDGTIAQMDVADHLAALHALTWDSFGFTQDTVIGGLPQPNPPTGSWVTFFRDHRLLYMAKRARSAGRLPAATHKRIEKLAAKLPTLLDEPPAPSLIHGDAWSGNLICRGGRVAAFIDPAIYFADAEIELAFGTLFGTFDPAFFVRYQERRPLRPGFWESRRDILNLYPLLVHVRLFGGAYLSQVEATLSRFTK